MNPRLIGPPRRGGENRPPRLFRPLSWLNRRSPSPTHPPHLHLSQQRELHPVLQRVFLLLLLRLIAYGDVRS